MSTTPEPEPTTTTTAATARTPATPPPHPRRWPVLGLLALAQFMLILDVTVVAIALPLMGADLMLDRETVTWVVSAYTLTFGGLMLLGGRMADLFGPRRLVLAGLVVFALASFTAGAAQDGTTLLLGRVGQGLGAAMLSPAALSIVVRLFEGEERNRALGIWSALGGGGAAAGVLLGGVIAGGPGWPWVFWVNVPIGVVVVALLTRLMPALPPVRTGHRGRLDVLGALLATAATGTGIYALISAGEGGWLTRRTLTFLALSAVGYVLFVWRQRTASSPLVEPGLLARRPVAAGVFVIGIATALMVAVFFLGSFYLQEVAGLGPLATGLLFLPVALLTMAGANLGGRLIGRTGGRALAVWGLLVAAAGLAVPVVSATTTGVVVGISVGAAGIGGLFVVAAATALGNVAPHEAGVTSGVLSTFHELGASIGAAVVSSVAAAGLAAQTGAGYSDAFTLSAIAAAASALIAGTAIPARRD